MASFEGPSEVAKPAAKPPSYSKLIYSAIESMKERAGWERYLPRALRKQVATGNLTKVKQSYKIKKGKSEKPKVKKARGRPRKTAAKETDAAEKPSETPAAVKVAETKPAKVKKVPKTASKPKVKKAKAKRVGRPAKKAKKTSKH